MLIPLLAAVEDVPKYHCPYEKRYKVRQLAPSGALDEDRHIPHTKRSIVGQKTISNCLTQLRLYT